MNNYFPSAFEDYSFEYSSSSIPRYCYSPFLPTVSCPVHSPHIFYTSTNTSPTAYTYHQQQLPVYSPPVQPQTADRTPLRRHQCFKKNELQILQQVYSREPHPSTAVLQQLAEQLKVSIDKVRQWFKNRRHSDKQKRREVPTTQSSTNF